MPAKSLKQRRLFGMIVAYKKGKLPNASKQIKLIAKGISLLDALHFARKVLHKGDNKLKLMDLINLDKVIQGKDYKILANADTNSGTVVFRIVSSNPLVIRSFKTKLFADAIKKVYKGGVKIETNKFRRTYNLFAINTYDTSQASLLKVMNIMKQKILNDTHF